MISSSTFSEHDGDNNVAVSSSTITSPQHPVYEKTDILMKHDQFVSNSPLSPQSSISSIKSPDSTTFFQLNSPPSSSSLQSYALSPTPSSSASSIDVNPPSTEKVRSHVYSSSYSYQACTICGDKSLDDIFGAFACDSCGGFFKRTIKNNRHFTCVANRDCVLNKKTRNRCKACRLQRCYKVGMKEKGKTIFSIQIGPHLIYLVHY